MEIVVHLPERSEDYVSESLRELTKRVCEATGIDGGFGLGGEHGYGADFENGTFKMHQYCWCEREDCHWCAGCNCSESAFEYFIDGKKVSASEHNEWMRTYAGPMPSKVHKYGTPEYQKYSDEWDLKIKERNALSREVHTPDCDYCKGTGIFSSYGCEAGKGAPHFWHKPTGSKVWWYKYIGRSMEVLVTPETNWQAIFADCFASIPPTPDNAQNGESK